MVVVRQGTCATAAGKAGNTKPRTVRSKKRRQSIFLHHCDTRRRLLGQRKRTALRDGLARRYSSVSGQSFHHRRKELQKTLPALLMEAGSGPVGTCSWDAMPK